MIVPHEVSIFLEQINDKVVLVFHRLGSKKRAIIGKAKTNPKKGELLVEKPTYSIDNIFQGNVREYYSCTDFIMKVIEVVEIGGELP